MDPITFSIAQGASGASGDPKYVDDVFSIDLYYGNYDTTRSSITINNGIELGSNVAVSLNGKTITDTSGGSADYSNLINNIVSSPNSDYYYGSIDCYIDYGSAVVSTFYDLAPQGDNRIGVVYNTPTSITGYGSNNGSSWTNLGAVSYVASDWREGKFTRYNFESNTTAYRYYRLTVSGTKSLQEWRLGITDSELGKGGLVWTKNRNYSNHHQLYDTERGPGVPLYSSLTNGNGGNAGFHSFNNNGFTLTAGSGGTDALNGNSDDESVVWTFRKQEKFFDIITYNGSNGAQTIPHNLGSVPGMIIVKATNDSQNWSIYHRELGATKGLAFNTAVAGTSSVYWNDTAPTATHFTVGAAWSGQNKNYIAYLFAHDVAEYGDSKNESIIKCGSYTGSDSAKVDVELGFEPQFVLVKNTGTVLNVSSQYTGWYMLDEMRGSLDNNGENDGTLQANSNDDEQDTQMYYQSGNVDLIQARSSGFRVNYPGATSVSRANEKFVYMAIARSNKPPTDGKDVYQALAYSGSNGDIARSTNIKVDALFTQRTSGGTVYAVDRLRGESQYVTISGESDEGGQATGFKEFGNDYITQGNGPIANSTDSYSLNMFKRARGFFDVVVYKGDNSAGREIPHNLGAKPELMLIKNRNASYYWTVYAEVLGSGNQLRLPSDSFGFTTNDYDSTEPTPTVFTIGNTNTVNENNDELVAYLFASLDGVSQVGTYDGSTSSDVEVNCGFSAGARFILIKRTTGQGDWYLWNSVRGIVNGNDPYTLLNDSAQEVTSTDYIDPLATGFKVTSSAPAALNNTGQTYLYLAIA